jgi:phenylacetate-CoA ligase
MAVEKIPAPLSSWMHLIPYRFRLGNEYTKTCHEIDEFELLNSKQKKHWIFEKISSIVDYAFNHTQFYHDFYLSHGFRPEQLRSFEDIETIPIVRKSDLQQVALHDRSVSKKGSLLINTGGTSGTPLEFFVDKHAFAREWAHMHTIWQKLGYKTSHLKLTFRGKNLGDRSIAYNPVHNEYLINAYIPLPRVAESLIHIVQKKRISFLHGYPSSIYQFAEYCNNHSPDLASLLKQSLKGILFASEYPAPVYRDLIEYVFPVPSISWYGHSEMAVLAYERYQPYVYNPFQTYGFCEALPGRDGVSCHLIGTSYCNTASPFIRYDTGDLIKPAFHDDLLKSFEIAEGRIGDFIQDAMGQKISLTALIFGRHHPIFKKARFIQVCQNKPGEALLLVNLRDGYTKEKVNWKKDFDSTGINLQFQFRLMNRPVITSSGKVPLVITPEKLMMHEK